ncbi:MAG: methyltransferase domain-containing protein [Pseudomonadota bacterium]
MNAECQPRTGEDAHERSVSPQQRRLVDAFLAFSGKIGEDSILEVVRTGARAGSHACVSARASKVENACKSSAQQHDAKKAMTFDVRHLPFSDGEFDWVFCADVIEHAGGFERQYDMLKELTRVARRGVFLTTRNRWHPLESNTGLLFLHWLPAAWWRRILKLTGKTEWSGESALNLLDAGALQKLASFLPGRLTYDIGHVRRNGIKAHFFLQLRKKLPAKPEA